MLRPIHILLLEDYDLISLGVKITLENAYKNMLRFKSVTDADAALDYLQKHKVDVLLLDLILKSEQPTLLHSGDELLRTIHHWIEKPKTIVLSKIDSLDILNYCIEQLEADAYILKSKTSLEELVPAIETVLEHENYFSFSVRKLLKYQFGLLDIDTTDITILKALSNGLVQRKIVILLEQKALPMTLSAVEKRIKKLKIRFDAETTSHLVATAIRKGII